MRNSVSQLEEQAAIHILNSMTALQNHAFQNLLSAWRRREEVRSTDTIGPLTEARISLEDARVNMRQAFTPHVV